MTNFPLSVAAVFIVVVFLLLLLAYPTANSNAIVIKPTDARRLADVPKQNNTVFEKSASDALPDKTHWQSIYHPETWAKLINTSEFKVSYSGHTFIFKALEANFVRVVENEFRGDQYCIAATKLGKKPLILDVGANIGFFSVLMGKMYPEATIFAFEPVEMNFAALNYNLGRNGISNVIPFNFGISNRTGVQRIQSIHFWNQGGSSMDNQQEDWGFDTFHVQTKTLRDTMELLRVGNRTIDFLKVDCEGCEYFAFDFADSFTKDMLARVKHLSGEIHSKHKGKSRSVQDFSDIFKSINPDMNLCLHSV